MKFDLPSSVSIPQMLYRIRGQYVCLYNHLEVGISFVISNARNPKTEDYFIDDAMEEFWHVALYPYLVERLNRNLRSRTLEPSDRKISKILLIEGEALSKAFALASFAEFKQKKGYDVPRREPKSGEGVIVEKIKRAGIRNALREVCKSGGLWDLEAMRKGN